MIRHIWSVLCAKTSIDRTTNNISLFEVLENIRLVSNVNVEFPANIPFDATLATYWARAQANTPTTAQMRVRVLGPDGQELTVAVSAIDLQASARARSMVQFNGIRVAGNGEHQFEVSFRQRDAEPWTVAANVPVDFSFAIDPALGQQPQ